MAYAKALPTSVTPIDKTKNKSGKLEFTFAVKCVVCGRLRNVRRRQHALHMSVKPCKRCSNRNNHPQGTFRGIRISFFKKYKVGAEQRSKKWDLSIEEAADILERQNYRCALTGLPLLASGDFPNITASLDRKDNSLGYTASNVQWVHKDVNMMRGPLGINRFLELCCAVASHHTNHITTACAS